VQYFYQRVDRIVPTLDASSPCRFIPDSRFCSRSTSVHDHVTEYNDNPLYSVGKQKRGAMRSGDSGAGSAPEQTTTSQAGDETTSHSHHGFSMSSDNTTSLAATMELFTQRSEKKRLKKSLKKLSKAQNGIGQTAESNGFQNENGEEMAATGDGNCLDDGNRKHHKHKKRKKHKKHHRKNASEEAEPSAQEYLTTTQDAEQPQLPAATAAAAAEEPATAAPAAQRVKVEVKVKSEQLDMEEETTSNLMSEVSDEVRSTRATSLTRYIRKFQYSYIAIVIIESI